MPEDAILLKIKLTRGTSTDDRDAITATVSGATVAEARERVEELKLELEEWVEGFRELQPEAQDEGIGSFDDDQATLAATEESDA